VVEDDEGIREGLGELLSGTVDVCGVATVGEALELMKEGRFALVIADLSLGDHRMGGREVAEAARNAGIPVAILSASPRSDVTRALQGIKPDVIVSKPFQLDEIEALVARFAGGSRAEAT